MLCSNKPSACQSLSELEMVLYQNGFRVDSTDQGGGHIFIDRTSYRLANIVSFRVIMAIITWPSQPSFVKSNLRGHWVEKQDVLTVNQCHMQRGNKDRIVVSTTFLLVLSIPANLQPSHSIARNPSSSPVSLTGLNLENACWSHQEHCIHT